MKKILLGTSALVAGGLLATPAFAADPIKISVIGYLQMYVGVGHFDKDGTAPQNKYEAFNFKYEGEIWFQGQTKLDNGTTVGLRIEMEGWSQGGISYSGSTDTKDQIDEEYLFAFGDWGRIEFGSHDAASYNMQYSTPQALIGHSFNQHNFGWRGNIATGANAADHGGFTSNPGLIAVDSNKLTYYTPRIAGFQLGVSFMPYFRSANSTLGGNAAQCGFLGGAGNPGACPKNSDDYHYGLDGGLNYLNKFGDVSVALYAGAAWASVDRSPTSVVPTRDFWGWAIGTQIGFYGWTVGGGVGQDNNGLKKNTTTFYTAGVMYETGPWQASFGWWHGSRKEGSTAVQGSGGAIGTDKVNYFTLGANYAIGPGVKLVGGVIYDARKGQTIAERADAWQILFGTELRF